jgi:ubiquinone/menaquinone biosynthesis C-methylase UbiE
MVFEKGFQKRRVDLQIRKMSENYLGRIDPKKEEWESSQWTELVKERYRIAAMFAGGKTVLDSCCGTGFGTMKFIVPEAKFTVGFDLFDSAKKDYGKTDKFEFLEMSGTDIKLDPGVFDVVLSLDAVEHFKKEDGIKYLAEMKRVCGNEGLIIGTTPLVVDRSLIPNYLGWNKYHLFMFTKEILNDTLKNIFPFVKIYEIYSEICPYFLFLCGKNKWGEDIECKMDNYIAGHELSFNKSRAANYLSWSKILLKKGNIYKSVCLFSKAFLLK